MTRRILIGFVLIAAGAVALTGALELFLRVAGYGAPRLHQPDRDLGWTLRTSLPGVNPAGLRDREHLLDKRDGVYRIAVLGDGYSEALHLPVQLTWWRLLPGELERCGFQRGQRIEMLNFGVSGYGTAQQHVMLETRVLRYRPDLVLLQFSADDVHENSFALASEKARPFYVLDTDARLRIDESFSSSTAFVRELSLGAQLMQRVADRSRVLQLARGRPAQPAPQPALFAAPREPLWQEAWHITERLVAMSAEASARQGARLVLVTAGETRYPERRIAEFSNRSGIRAVTTGAQASAAGHRAAAAAVANALCIDSGELKNDNPA